MIDLWAGVCNQWDIDEMGHMNVRIYVEKQLEGLAVFAHKIAMPHAFRTGGPTTLVPVEQHIRYMREVMAGRPVTMVGCVIEIGECDAVIYQEMRHSDGSVAAAFRTRVEHVDTTSREAFPWTSKPRKALEALVDTPPAETAPRSLALDGGASVADISYEKIAEVGAPSIGMGAVPPAHLDVHGHMLPSWFIGRISDSVPNLLYDWRSKQMGSERRVGAAVLEYHMRYHALPKAGDLYEVHSGLGQMNEKTHTFIHWVMDPDTGRPWATCEALAVSLDLDARKVIAAPPETKAALKELVPSGLFI